METYRGGCHCGMVQFEVDTDLNRAVECNCSICTKKGILHHRVAPENFRLMVEDGALGLYQFGSRTASHWFCRHCGIHIYNNPRAAPDMVNINVRCLDGVDLDALDLDIVHFDGRNWEQAIKTFRV